MKRWKDADSAEVINETIDSFLEEIVAICKKYNLSICSENDYDHTKIKRSSCH